ncbi:hypothetical protein [Ferroplasma sp.]|uniref:hypothetical protein n=1 Tax=Ferroplasma sp. TaxID=2591003 RepID=UPI00307EE48B
MSTVYATLMYINVSRNITSPIAWGILSFICVSSARSGITLIAPKSYIANGIIANNAVGPYGNSPWYA